MEFVIATQNHNKTHEIQELLDNRIRLVNLKSLGVTDDIPENEDTLEGNARAKARFVYDRFQKPCFADDTGLEIDALGGAPGVYSARYAGPDKNSNANMHKVLEKLDGISIRTAQFRTIIILIINNIEILFEGKVKGEITTRPLGEQGFGYDPIFLPEGYDRTFAQMNLEEKNAISHRALAINKFAEYVKSLSI